MTHHQFGTMVGDSGIGGIVDIPGSVLFDEYRTLAVPTVSSSHSVPVLAVELTGRVTASEDTVTVVYLVSLLDAGLLAGALLNAAEQLGAEAATDFAVGVRSATRSP